MIREFDPVGITISLFIASINRIFTHFIHQQEQCMIWTVRQGRAARAPAVGGLLQLRGVWQAAPAHGVHRQPAQGDGTAAELEGVGRVSILSRSRD